MAEKKLRNAKRAKLKEPSVKKSEHKTCLRTATINKRINVINFIKENPQLHNR